MDLIEQCEAEEGFVPKPLQPLSSMPTISPATRRRTKKNHSDSSSSTSSDDSSSEVIQFSVTFENFDNPDFNDCS